MARSILIIGEPGTGKTTSMYSLDPKSTMIITPNSKDIPIPGSAENYTIFDKVSNPGGNRVFTEQKDAIKPMLLSINKHKPNVKTIVIDDFSHYLTHRIMSRAFIDDEGYTKWNEFGASVYNALFGNLEAMRKDLTIIVMHHSELKDNGMVAEKTAGKLMDNTIMVSSWFTVVLHSKTIQEGDVTRYMFQTNRQGQLLAKSPAGMFSDIYVRNNMKEVLDQMEAYYAGKSKNEVVFI